MSLSLFSSVLPRWLSRRPALANEPTSQLVKRSPTDALLFYSTPGVAPPSARIDPKLKIAIRRPLRVWEYWKFAAVAASKATHVTSEVLSHKIWGPRRKTWGIEMTILTSLIREMERHANLVDIDLVRTVIGLGGLIPLPSDALVTPVTFHVKKRGLLGILAQCDAAETGQRELHGEWVVGKKTWQRLQQEWKSGNEVDGESPRNPPKRKERVILYVHGGAYYLSSAAVQRVISIPLSKYADARVFAIDYRLAPESCFPGPLHDVVSGYLRLVEDLHIPPENIIVAGDSAGGALSIALLFYLRDNGYTLPSGAILLSPWCDLTLSCESWDLNSAYDVVPFPTANCHMNPIALYLGEHMEEYLTHPYASPLFGDMKGLPPLLIQAGDAEVLRDEITLFAHKASLAGVEVMHELYEDCIHVFQAYPFLDASKQAFASIRNFVKQVLPQIQSRSPQLLPSITEQGLEQEMEKSAVIVCGDGAEMAAGEELMRDFERASSSSTEGSDDDKEVSPSWVRSPAWPRKRHSPVFALGKDGKSKETGSEIEMLEDTSTLGLDQIPDIQLSPPIFNAERTRTGPYLLRPRSQTLLSPLELPQQTSQPKAKRHRSYHKLRASALMMSAVHSPPPSPAIRAAVRSTSHPDLTSLVENWSKKGPANQTLRYSLNLHPVQSS